MSRSESIPRIDEISRKDFVRDFLSTNSPVVLSRRTLAKDAIHRWTLDSVVAANGDRMVSVEHYPHGKRRDAFVYRKMTLREYVELVRDSTTAQRKFYLAEQPLSQMLPATSDDYGLPAIVASNAAPRTVGFFGFNTYSTCHYHRFRTQALLTQVIGSKRLLLFHPCDTKNLYLSSWYGLRSNHSRIPFDRACFEKLLRRYKKLARTKPLEVLLQPGDSLFIPDHWMHTAEGIDCSLSITTFWDESLRYVRKLGYVRDQLGHTSKSMLRVAARAADRMGCGSYIGTWAARFGFIRPGEAKTVQDYLSENGAKLPMEVLENEMEPQNA